ncbi:hypothetical protein DPMN_000960 [Dreissena polymorpha]|uniref:Uncharacterized protein n=1 Tax=Dreissena polymorpha TaxID=45954 RepID=A0A9D4MK16_DREPO|nr:hypothetical protein DPMN_000960 [Dreissena polymorpha]
MKLTKRAEFISRHFRMMCMVAARSQHNHSIQKPAVWSYRCGSTESFIRFSRMRLHIVPVMENNVITGKFEQEERSPFLGSLMRYISFQYVGISFSFNILLRRQPSALLLVGRKVLQTCRSSIV